MIKNYFKIAFRNLIKNKIYSFINIAGLAIGLASFVLISTYLKNEISFDRFHEKADRIYRPVEIQKPPGIAPQHVAVTMGPLAQALKEDFPEIENACRIKPEGTTFCRVGERGFYEDAIAFADNEFLSMFNIEFINGDLATALSDPTAIVINEEIAEKYFPGDDPIGKIMLLEHWSGDLEYKVTGVMKEYPRNSHLDFRMLASLQPLIESQEWMRSWHSNFLATYVLLRQGQSPGELEDKFPEFIKRHIEAKSWNEDMEMYLQPLKDIHLFSHHIKFQTYNRQQGSIKHIYTFSIIAIFILLIACINFMNLSTARSVKRAKEVGMRKVLGSQRMHLIYQFLGESVIISFLALVLALGIVQLVFPYFKEILGDRIYLEYYQYDTFMLELIGVTLLAGIIAGSYPAFFLSSYKPVQTLKGNFNVTAEGRSSALRKVLVVFQFAIAIILIINTGIVVDQINYIQNRDLGYNTNQVVYLTLRSNEERGKIEVLRSELLKNPRVVSVAASAGLSGASGSQGTVTVAGTNGEQSIMMRRSYVDFDFINTLGMQIVEGRNFSQEFATDTSRAVIINQAAARELGWNDPLGRQFEGSEHNLSVIGVVKDFNFYKLTEKIEPLIMQIVPERFSFLLIKIRPENIPGTLDFIEQTWNAHLPGRPYDYDFLNEHFARLYKSEQNTGKLFGAFAGLAIFVACLGLFGLAAFTAEQRMKEIGIRKVLGASLGGIVVLLSKEFLKWVAIAGLIAFPVAYFTGRDWLENFAYRTEIDFSIFLLAAGVALLIALATVSYQAIKAALMNPVDTLKYE